MKSDPQRGREGIDDWVSFVLAAVRLGCDFDYDQLQDLAENRRHLRQIMGVGEWEEEEESFRPAKRQPMGHRDTLRKTGARREDHENV